MKQSDAPSALWATIPNVFISRFLGVILKERSD
jgi:hypothetical protein